MARNEFEEACAAVPIDQESRSLPLSDGRRLWIHWDDRRNRLQFYVGRDIVHIDRAWAEALVTALDGTVHSTSSEICATFAEWSTQPPFGP